MPKITIIIDLKTVTTITTFAEKGTKLSEVILKSPHSLDMPCGGAGSCGKCRVFIPPEFSASLSVMSSDEKRLLSDSDIAKGVRLSCLCTVSDDLTVMLESSDNINNIHTTIEGKNNTEQFSFAPSVKVVEIIADKTNYNPTLENQTPDIEWLKTTVGLTSVSLSALKKLPFMIASGIAFNAVVCGDSVIDLTYNHPLGVAVDIGTTTVAIYAYDLCTGEKIGSLGEGNRQRSYGADVISRIDYCNDTDKLNGLQSLIAGQLNDMAYRICTSDDIYQYVITGNTTMQHIAAGISPSKIAQAPFIPVTLFGCAFTPCDLGLSMNQSGTVYFTPSVASYVGGDITSGILYSRLYDNDVLSLLVDIGTNGEIVLGSCDGIVCCSTAAGPAFEGAHIRHGMSGISGAIDSVSIIDGKVYYTTIDNAPVKGICGSGLISAVSALCGKIIDETGRIMDTDEMDEAFSHMVDEDDDGMVFILCKNENGGDILLTQKDIREVQLAKSAIAAGIATLLNHIGKDYDDIGEVYIAGGFGLHVDKSAACNIGLLPKSLEDRIITIGNAAGMGCVMSLLSELERGRLEGIAKNMSYLELSGNPFFMDRYVDEMMF